MAFDSVVRAKPPTEDKTTDRKPYEVRAMSENTLRPFARTYAGQLMIFRFALYQDPDQERVLHVPGSSSFNVFANRKLLSIFSASMSGARAGEVEFWNRVEAMGMSIVRSHMST